MSDKLTLVTESDYNEMKKSVALLEAKEIREMSYDETMNKATLELDTMDIDSIPSWGFQEFDETFGLMMGGQVYVVGGVTGTGKSTFINQICQNTSRQGFRCSLYTLEDRIESIRQNDLYFAINRIRKQYSTEPLIKWKFMAGMYKNIPERKQAEDILRKQNTNLFMLKHNGKVTIKIIEEMIKEAHKNGSRIVAIDHLHYFDTSENVASDRHDLVIKDIMHRINTLARELFITIILVAHYKKIPKGEKPSLNEFSGSISIAQVANGIIHIYRNKADEFEPNKTEFIIDKNRDMGITKTITGNFNLKTYEYEFTESEIYDLRKKR